MAIFPEILLASGHEDGSQADRILVIDDDEGVRKSLSKVLQAAKYHTELAENAKDAFELLKSESFDYIICDLKMPEMDGIAFIDQFLKTGGNTPVILMSAYATLNTALDALQAGAQDYVAKPYNAEDLLWTLTKLRERLKLKQENKALKAELGAKYNFKNIIGKSAKMDSVFEVIRKIADYRTTILIRGDSGTGKELIAKAIHFNSSRKNKPFVAINCGAIPEHLLESELFGHKKGSFTDATKDKKGLFAEANNGTLFLDEIGELPKHLQVKLLRVLQENEIRRVGDTVTTAINVRVIAATLRDLEADVDDGRFRDDLFYRLNVISLNVPSLKERKEDIPVLIDHFIKENQARLKLSVRGISPEAMDRLMSYDWPGNIRELENCVERAMILTEGDKIALASLPPQILNSDKANKQFDIADDDFSIKQYTKQLEENLIKAALEKTGGNRTHAAKLLEISHRTLLYKLKEYGIDQQKTKNTKESDSTEELVTESVSE